MLLLFLLYHYSFGLELCWEVCNNIHMETQVIIVDKDNNIIGHKSRSELTSEDIYRVSAVRITDENGKILLGQRALTKKKNP